MIDRQRCALLDALDSAADVDVFKMTNFSSTTSGLGLYRTMASDMDLLVKYNSETVTVHDQFVGPASGIFCCGG